LQATVLVKAVHPVGKFRNLLEGSEGSELVVRIPKEAAKSSGLQAGSQVRLQVRQGGIGQYFGHPDHVTKVG
jgi:hypothetical protein